MLSIHHLLLVTLCDRQWGHWVEGQQWALIISILRWVNTSELVTFRTKTLAQIQPDRWQLIMDEDTHMHIYQIPLLCFHTLHSCIQCICGLWSGTLWGAFFMLKT